MTELKMWDFQMIIACEIAKLFKEDKHFTEVIVYNQNTPCTTATYNKSNSVTVMIHLYKKVFQIQLIGAREDITVDYYAEDDVITGIMNQLNVMLSKPMLSSVPSRDELIDKIIEKKIDYLVSMDAPFDKKGLTSITIGPSEFALENMVMGDVLTMMGKLRKLGILNVLYNPQSEVISGECNLYEIPLNNTQFTRLASAHDMRKP